MQIRYTALSMLNPQSRDSSGERATRNKHPRVSPAELPLQAPRRCFIFTNEGQRHGGLPLTFNIPNATSAKDLHYALRQLMEHVMEAWITTHDA